MIYRISTDQIVVTKDYQTVPVLEDLVDAIRKIDSYDNKSQVDDFDAIYLIVHDGQSNNNNDDGHTPFSDEDQYLHGTVSTILSLQPYLTVLIHENILHHFHNDTSMMTPPRL